MTVLEIGSRRWPGDHPMMDLERIFLRKLDDLARRTAEPRFDTGDAEYELLMAAPLLREILFGTPTPLIHAANREHRLRLQFRFVDQEPLPAHFPVPTVQAMGNLSIDDHPPHMVEQMGLDQFLAARVAHVHGEPVSVRDIVDYAANAAGGVHLGNQEKNNRPRVRAIDESIRMEGWSFVYVMLAKVGETTVRGLEPLAEKVRQDYERPT